MKRTLPRLLGVVALATLLSSGDDVSATAFQKDVNVATSPLPVVIAVLSDHYTDQAEFDLDVENFITYGLLAHPYYQAHKADLQIVSFYEALQAGKQSNYGFNVELPSGNCAMSWTVSDDDSTNTATLVEDVVGAINPRLTIVIGDHPYNIGCTDGALTYVATDAVGTDVLSHELGHGLANLDDEWFYGSNSTVDHPGIPANQTRNCHDTRNGSPWWLPAAAAALFPGAGSLPGCDFFKGKVVHGFEGPHTTPNGTIEKYCLMGSTPGATFCPICRSFMEPAFNPDLPNPDIENPSISNPDIANPDVENPRPRNSPPPGPPKNVRIIKTAYVQQPGRMQIMNAAFTEQTPAPKIPGPVAATGTTKPATGSTGSIGQTGSTGSTGATGVSRSIQKEQVPPRPMVRVIAAFNPETGRLRFKKGTPIVARYVPSNRRLGEWAYEIVVNKQTYVGVIPSNLYKSRSYQGGVAHGASRPHEADITIQIPDITDEMLTNGKFDLSLRVYRLSSDVKDSVITPAILAGLKGKGADERGTALTAKDLISVR